jgi:hypothetical protein
MASPDAVICRFDLETNTALLELVRDIAEGPGIHRPPETPLLDVQRKGGSETLQGIGQIKTAEPSYKYKQGQKAPSTTLLGSFARSNGNTSQPIILCQFTFSLLLISPDFSKEWMLRPDRQMGQ